MYCDPGHRKVPDLLPKICGEGIAMTASTPMPRRAFLGALGAGATMLGIGACSSNSGSSGTSGSGGDPNAAQTINWWHIANTAPMLDIWQQMADLYHQQHSNVTIKVTPISNEDF